jgi:AAA+ superfamily predicted ATPase
MTTALNNIKATELFCKANNIRIEIRQKQKLRADLAGKVNDLFLEGIDIAIENLEDQFIAATNEANALLRNA